MKTLYRALITVSFVALAACSNNKPGAYGSDGYGGGTGAGTSDIVQGSVNDPTSPAYFQQTVGDRVYFTVDQSTVDASAQSVLVAQADWLMANPEYRITIEGHADEQGTREYNLALGARRANAVREYLASRGVNADRMQTVSYGKERPAELCSAESCYAMNRRAVSVLNNLNF